MSHLGKERLWWGFSKATLFSARAAYGQLQSLRWKRSLFAVQSETAKVAAARCFILLIIYPQCWIRDITLERKQNRQIVPTTAEKDENVVLLYNVNQVGTARPECNFSTGNSFQEENH
jgi:hypothetical protein